MVKELILIGIGQFIVFLGAFAKLWFSNEQLKERVAKLESVNEKLLEKIGQMSEDTAVIKSHFEMGTLSKLKTANR